MLLEKVVEDIKVRLRKFKPTDTELIEKWWSDCDATLYLFGFYSPPTRYRVEEWLNGEMKKENNPIFAIEVEGQGQDKKITETIGYCGLRGIDSLHRHADFKILIGEKEQWKNGYGFIASSILLKYGFHYLNLHRINANVFESNVGSVKLMTKLGFQKEGSKREYAMINNKWEDFLVYGLLEEEFDYSK